ncbi:class I SAM-dependent methyltransferase [Kolteria novifilia]
MDPVRAFDQLQADYWTTRTNLRSHDHPVVRSFANQRVEFIKGKFGDWRPSTALEVGCGDGFGMQHMNTLVDDIHGCDLSPAMLEANPAPADRLTLAEAYDLPFESDQFELVYCWELLHHVGDPSRAVSEMKRVGRRAVMLCEPNSLNVAMAAFGLLEPAERGLLRFTPGYTKRLLVEAGLSRVTVYSVACFTPNQTPPWLARVLSLLPYRWPYVGLYNIAIGYL